MLLDDGSADVQPKTQTDARAAQDLCPRYAVEALPHAPLFGGRDAWPLVAHRDARPAITYAQTRCHLLLVTRVFERIAQIIDDNLSDTILVSQHDRRLVCCARNLQKYQPLWRYLALLLDNITHNMREIAWRHP